jgi:cyclic-di-AMP phosphodiesterase PgpH
LHGGQFDESGLTLRELRTIEKSMVMSVTSIYHGRIKYPDQRTA